jgi:hypothetical protein
MLRYAEGSLLPGWPSDEFSDAPRVRDVYLVLERDAAVVARAQQLLEHPTPSLRADDRNYLAQLAAVATANPDFVGISRPINASIR